MEVPKTKRRGRQKMEMKKVEDEKKRLVTFTKRRQGLFKKACELSKYGAKTALVVFSQNGKPYSCGDVEGLFDQYLTGKVPESANAGVEKEEEEKKGFWWEKTVDETMLGWFMGYEARLIELKKNVEAKLVEVRRLKAQVKASSSSSSSSSNDHDGNNQSVIVNVNDQVHCPDEVVDDQFYGENFDDLGVFGLHGGGGDDGWFSSQ